MKKLPQTRLTDEDVRGIRYAGLVERMPQADIAKTYRISQAYVSLILSKQRRQGVKRSA